MKDEKKETFTYAYSASEQEEIRKIREKYSFPSFSKEETPLQKLRRLDKSTTKSASAVSFALGIVGTFAVGIGMCCTTIPGWERYFILGVVLGAAGILSVVAAYPVYTLMVKRKRAKLAPEIMQLSEKLMK